MCNLDDFLGNKTQRLKVQHTVIDGYPKGCTLEMTINLFISLKTLGKENHSENMLKVF